MGRNEDILELRKQGKAYIEIGRKYGISKQRVHMICKKLGLNKHVYILTSQGKKNIKNGIKKRIVDKCKSVR